MEAAEFSFVETGEETKSTVSRTFETFSRFDIGKGRKTSRIYFLGTFDGNTKKEFL